MKNASDVAQQELNMSAVQRKQFLKGLWWVLVGCVVCYWIVSRQLTHLRSSEPRPVISMVLAVMAVMEYSFAWGWYLMTIGPIARQALPTSAHRLSLLDGRQLQRRLWTTIFIVLTLLEAAPIYGLVNMMVSASVPRLFDTLLLASLFGLVLVRLNAFPTVFELFDRLEHRVAQAG